MDGKLYKIMEKRAASAASECKLIKTAVSRDDVDQNKFAILASIRAVESDMKELRKLVNGG